MAIAFPLEKSTEGLKLALEKHEVNKIIPCQVKLAMDVSGSFDDEHCEGYTQDLINRFVPFALIFDKDGVIDSYTFSHKAGKLPLISKDNFENYIRKQVIGCAGYGGMTSYTPVLKLIDSEASPQSTVVEHTTTKPAGMLGRLFGKKDEKVVTHTTVSDGIVEKELVFFVTDGEADDTTAAKTYLERMGKNNVFFVFISVGDRDIRLFKDSFVDTPFSIYIKLTKSQIRDLKNWTDEKMYDMLLQPSLVAWMNKEV